MPAQSSPMQSTPTENTEDDPTAASDSQYLHDDADASQGQDVLVRDGAPALDLKQIKGHNPMQKRRRVTRACDECRRKKIKCDGKQPCTHCSVYSYECTYDQPSNRRRNPAPQYIEALESRLHKAEALLRVVLPDLNLDDPRFDVHATEQLLAAIKKDKVAPSVAKPPAGTKPESGADPPEESLLESMVDNSGALDLDDQGNWDYHGHSSGLIFIRRLRNQLSNSDAQSALPNFRPPPQMLESPKSTLESPDSNVAPTHDLPSRAVARRLCRNALEVGCALMRFVHEPSFYAMFDRIYDTPPEQYTNQENSFLPFLYIVLGVGCLFSGNGEDTLDLSGYESAIGQGFHFFKAGRQLLDITDCRDLSSLQAICFMVIFLQSSAKLSTCYSYVGIALRSALRLGLHRKFTAKFNPVEQELRKRIFWVIRKMDVYASTLLGLPLMLSDDDIDQEYPLAIDDEFITPEGILPSLPDRTPLMAGANAHARLTDIIMKVVRYIYPVKNPKFRSKSDNSYMVSHSKIREIEQDLQTWMEELPSSLRPGTEVSPQLERVRQLLRIGYAHVQMIMYRPFLHYVSGGSQARGVDKRSYACAAACVSVSRNIVHITTGMHKRGLLSGSFWFTMYTTYFAILSLIFFVLENPDSPTAKDGVLKDAMEGKATLAGLAKKSMAADRCSQSLTCLFKHLPELLKNRQSTRNRANLKRSAPSDQVRSAQAPPEPGPPLKRVNTSSTPAISRPSRPESISNTPRNIEEFHSYNTTPRSYVPQTPDPTTEAFPIASDAFMTDRIDPSPTTSSYNSSVPSHEPSGLSFTQQPSNSNLPDLMPIMFPSEDPFAYPTQPMSTLEDDHFKHDNGATSTQLAFNPTSQPQTASGPIGLPTTGFENFNIPAFPNGSATGMNPVVSGHFRQPSHSHSQSHAATPVNGEGESPDLVSIPDQNFIFQSFSFPPQLMSTGQGSQQQQHQVPAGSGSQNFGMNMDGTRPIGTGIDMDMGNIPLDDIFGNATGRPTGSLAADEWIQWMV